LRAYDADGRLVVRELDAGASFDLEEDLLRRHVAPLPTE